MGTGIQTGGLKVLIDEKLALWKEVKEAKEDLKSPSITHLCLF